jgi:hypothetical protein
MANKWTRTAAFRLYNIDPRNINWSWSGRSSDGNTVAVTLWKDELKGPAGQMVYDRVMDDWHNGHGRRYFFQDLAWAHANCDGIVKVIVAVRDPKKPNRAIESYPQKGLMMRIIHFDPVAGTFRLEQVSTAIRSVKPQPENRLLSRGYPGQHSAVMGGAQ